MRCTNKLSLILEGRVKKKSSSSLSGAKPIEGETEESFGVHCAHFRPVHMIGSGRGGGGGQMGRSGASKHSKIFRPRSPPGLAVEFAAMDNGVNVLGFIALS